MSKIVSAIKFEWSISDELLKSLVPDSESEAVAMSCSVK